MERLYAARWAGGKPSCPWCGSMRVSAIKTRHKHRCNHPACRRDFSVLSGTPFSSSKISAAKLLKIIDAFVGCEAPSIHALSQQLGHQYKTVYVIARKVIEVIENHPGEDALRACLRSTKSTAYRGYWQRRALESAEVLR